VRVAPESLRWDEHSARWLLDKQYEAQRRARLRAGSRGTRLAAAGFRSCAAAAPPLSSLVCLPWCAAIAIQRCFRGLVRRRVEDIEAGRCRCMRALLLEKRRCRHALRRDAHGPCEEHERVRACPAGFRSGVGVWCRRAASSRT
jgi:hypothetical protein